MSESTNTTTRTTVIIGKSEQYEPWIHQTQATALEHKIWEYMDPEMEESARPKLVEPMPPTVLTVISMEEIIERRRNRALVRVTPVSSSTGGATLTLTPTNEVDTTSALKLSELNTEEQLTYSMYVSLYTRSIKLYDTKSAVLRKMCSQIQQTVAPAYQYILYNKKTALERMLAVKKQFKPTTVATTRLIVRD